MLCIMIVYPRQQKTSYNCAPCKTALATKDAPFTELYPVLCVKGAISQIRMELVERVSMGRNLQMKIFLRSTLVQVFCQWLMRDQILMALNSSSPWKQLLGWITNMLCLAWLQKEWRS